MPTEGISLSRSVLIVVTWVEPRKNDFAYMNLLQSLDLFRLERYSETIIPANVAVELVMKKVVKAVLSEYGNTDAVGNMLKGTNNLVHHASMFKVLLPIAANLIGFPLLRPEFIQLLTSMNANRNEIAHEGKPKAEFDMGLAADFICASFFTLSYLRLMEEHLKQKGGAQRCN